jgi:hypothetical protein
VVVAAGTCQRDPQETLGHHVELVVNACGLVAEYIDRCVGCFTEEPESGTNDRFVKSGIRVTSRVAQQVARQVLNNELVIWNVLVQGPNQVIPILVGMVDGIIKLVSMALGIANEIHPVPSPTLAKMR